jgi:GNAT superfamily N-acetyltransferase
VTSILPPEGEHLTTGWESDLTPEDSVVRQAVLAHARWAVELARCAGRPWHETPQWAGGHVGDRGPMTNWVILKQPVGDPGRVLGQVNTLFPAGVPYLFISAWPTADLTVYGLALVGHPPLMLRPASAPTPRPDSALELRWVRDAGELAAAERVLVVGYPLPELQPFVPGRMLAPALLDGGTRVVVAWDGDQPLATATAYAAHGVTLVENVAVLPEARGKGAGAAVTWAATMSDQSQPAVLIASDDGQPVYQRLGYLRLERWTVWLRA